MQIFRDFRQLSLQRSVVTIGNFDGLHLGHQSLIRETLQQAKQVDAQSVVLSFYPLPRAFFNPTALHQILPLRSKISLFKQWPIDFLGLIRFNQQFASLSPKQFVADCLVNALGAKCVIVGPDFKFGHQQQGDIGLLKALGEQFNFQVIIMPEVVLDGMRVSSSEIRHALTAGDIQRANEQLGYPFSLVARVQKGKQLGRKLGFPTANLAIAPKFMLLNGVYICQVERQGQLYPAVCNVGYQPTVSSYKKKIEVHLLDFNGDLYHDVLKVSFLKKIRHEKKFKDVSELIENIKHDTIIAKQYFDKLAQNQSEALR